MKRPPIAALKLPAFFRIAFFAQMCYGCALPVSGISGTGGQLDFATGAYMSEGGMSFICCNAAYTDKKTDAIKSRIVPTLPQGSIVTVPRTQAHLIVTEYGVADLAGKSTWQRAEALINVAHPDLRDGLIKDAEKMNIWRKASK